MATPDKYIKYAEELNNTPLFTTIAQSLGYERLGLQVLDGEEVFREYTSYATNGKIIRIEYGLKSPEVVAKVQREFLEKVTKKKEMEWIKKHPAQAAIKYQNEVDLPFFVKLRIMAAITV